MAAGTKADFKIYDEQYYAGQIDRQAQNISAFNDASNGALVLASRLIKGEYERKAFIKNLSGIIARRDPTSVAGVASVGLQSDEMVGVKVNRRIGPVEQTLDAWKKIAEDPETFSFLVGQFVADEKLKDMVNVIIASLSAALANQAGVTLTTGATITTTDFVDGFAKFGDAFNQLSMLVMHSKPFFDLVKDQVTSKIVNVDSFAVYHGMPVTFNKPVLVIDAPGLLVAGAPNTYRTLALTSGAGSVTESEKEDIEFQRKVGGENLTQILQGEYAFNVDLKGFSYDTAQGVNPTDATLATGANWVKKVADVKHLGGVCIVTQ